MSGRDGLFLDLEQTTQNPAEHFRRFPDDDPHGVFSFLTVCNRRCRKQSEGTRPKTAAPLREKSRQSKFPPPAPRRRLRECRFHSRETHLSRSSLREPRTGIPARRPIGPRFSGGNRVRRLQWPRCKKRPARSVPVSGSSVQYIRQASKRNRGFGSQTLCSFLYFCLCLPAFHSSSGLSSS